MTLPRLAGLDRQFGIPGRLRVTDRDGHPIVAIRTDTAEAELSLQGAQVLAWRPRLPHGAVDDVLWCAPLPPAGSSKAIRGGVPICWPWFGPHATDPSRPQHGLVRTAEWHLQETAATADAARVVLGLRAADCDLRLEAQFGTLLRIDLTTRNGGTAPITITEALHTYFRVGDVAAIEIGGLDGRRYRDNTDGGREKAHAGPCRIDRETVALFDDAPAITELADPVLRRMIRIARTGGRSTVVWNPGASAAGIGDLPAGEEKHFVCIESGNIGVATVAIPPGAEHLLSVTYSVLPL